MKLGYFRQWFVGLGMMWAMLASAEPALLPGQWLFEVPGPDRLVTVNARGEGEELALSGGKRPVKVTRRGEQLHFEYGDDAMTYAIVEASARHLVLETPDGREAELTLHRPAATAPSPRNTAPSSPVAKAPSNVAATTPSGAPRDAAASASSLLGTWSTGDGTIHFDRDGRFLIVSDSNDSDNGVTGGRVEWRDHRHFILHFFKRTGTLSYFHFSAPFELESIEPGRELVIRDKDNQQSRYPFVSDEHPLGSPDQLSSEAMVGYWLVESSSGARELWELKRGGRALLNRPTEFVAYQWWIDDQRRLVLKSPFRTYRFPIARFERGVGVLFRETSYQRMLPVHSQFSPPSLETPPPTKRQLEQALLQELQASQKSSASSSALNASTRAMTQMMDDIADDIAGRDYRYEWLYR